MGTAAVVEGKIFSDAGFGLSLTDAAEALGLSRRQVADYASGEHDVPRTVLLACKGWEAEQLAAA